MGFEAVSKGSAAGVSKATGSEASGETCFDAARGSEAVAGSDTGASAAAGSEASGAAAGSDAGVSVVAGSGVVAGSEMGVSAADGEAVPESTGGGVVERVDWEAGASAVAGEEGEASGIRVSAAAAAALDLEAGILDLGVDLRTVLTTRLLGAIATRGFLGLTV